MSWTDRKSTEVFKFLRDKFKVKTLIETGTFMGVNAELHSKNFDEVWTCELNEEYYKESQKRLKKYKNIFTSISDSPEYLLNVKGLFKQRMDIPLIYLDAHFFDPKLPKGKGKFVVLKELDSLKGFNCIIIIHDFCNGLGGIRYDEIDLDMDLLRNKLKKVNRNFTFYTNELKSCDIVKNNRKSIIQAGLPYDKEVRGNLEYAWREPRLTYRGLLYAIPSKLSNKELKMTGLREIK